MEFRVARGWGDIGGEAVAYRRTRDEMPGYRMGIEEALTIRAIAPPSDSRLAGFDAGALRWFEERSESADALAPARYAMSTTDGRVLYGEQCLTRKLCLAWQRWPAASR